MNKKGNGLENINLVVTYHIDEDSNLTNAFPYNCAIVIYDARRIGEKVPKKEKEKRAREIFRTIVNFLEDNKKELTHAYER